MKGCCFRSNPAAHNMELKKGKDLGVSQHGPEKHSVETGCDRTTAKHDPDPSMRLDCGDWPVMRRGIVSQMKITGAPLFAFLVRDHGESTPGATRESLVGAGELVCRPCSSSGRVPAQEQLHK